MHVIVGGGLLVSGLLIIALLTYLFARPQNPRWLDAELTAMVLSIPPTAMLGVGTGYTFLGLLGDHHPLDLVALVGWLAIGCGLIWLARRRRALLIQAAEAATAAGGPGGPHRTA